MTTGKPTIIPALNKPGTKKGTLSTASTRIQWPDRVPGLFQREFPQ
jgi:hypothetical protein